MPKFVVIAIETVREHLLVTVSIVVLVLCAGAAYGLAAYRVELGQQEKALQARHDLMFSGVTQQKRLDGLVNTTRAAVDYLEARLVKESELATNLDRFYQVEALTGVKIVSVTQMSPPATMGAHSPTYTSLPFSVQLTGTFPQVLAFIHELEYGSIPGKIILLNINRAGGGPAAPARPAGPAGALGSAGASALAAVMAADNAPAPAATVPVDPDGQLMVELEVEVLAR